MKKNVLICTYILLIMSVLNSCVRKNGTADFNIIPQPQSIVEYGEDAFNLNSSVMILYLAGNDAMLRNANFLNQYINEIHNFTLKTESYVMMSDHQYPPKCIVLELDPKIEHPEGYILDTDKENIIIRGGSEAGVYFGIQTLRKAMGTDALQFPSVRITDQPAFSYRGMHLDVARHFFNKDEVKRFIDMISLHNMNKMHWHLSDDQGWRVEIKKYPKLTEVGSKRSETSVAGNRSKFDGIPYGGFFTQEEIKEIVQYAKERYITIIPEIDLPGHMQAALTAYPHLGCTGGPYEVAKTWGVFDDVLCAGNDSVLIFIEDVLNEIIDLFPDSPYVHIGGDECPKTRWKACPKCQKKIRELRIKGDSKHTAEEYLQSYIITYASNVVKKRGKSIIGWDEILEGGLAPGATVMSWRGMDGGIKAAMQRHDVIMTPNSHCYFDYYQTLDLDNEPPANGNYIPLEKVFELDPVGSLPDEYKKYILGAQANLWSESMTSYEIVEYQALPRMAALADVVWRYDSKRSFDEFLGRLKRFVRLYDFYNYNYAKHIFDIKAKVEPIVGSGNVEFSLSTLDGARILYTLDGSVPKKGAKTSIVYDQPIVIGEDVIISAVAERDGKYSRVYRDSVKHSLSTGKKITLLDEPHRNYRHAGAVTLTDGLKGGKNYKQNRWLGFNRTAMDAVIDFGEATEIREVVFDLNIKKEDWVFDTRGYSLHISEDGSVFRQIVSEKLPPMKSTDQNLIKRYRLTFDPVTVRSIKLVVEPESKIPDWHGGKGSPGFIFIDEISVY